MLLRHYGNSDIHSLDTEVWWLSTSEKQQRFCQVEAHRKVLYTMTNHSGSRKLTWKFYMARRVLADRPSRCIF